MATKKDPLEQLETRRERLQALLAEESQRAAGVFKRLGFGYAMRAYSRLKNSSTRREDELMERLTTVEASLRALGWRDPRQPVPPARTPEEQHRHYCEVMGVAYVEGCHAR